MDTVDVFGARMFMDDAFKRMADRIVNLEQQVVNLEQQVANPARAMRAYKQLADAKMLASGSSASMKSQAAATQATEHLYAPLRSDTKPLLEMSAFVRKIADVDFVDLSLSQSDRKLIDVIIEAREILKRST